jgi:hypothetical protein
MLYKRCNLNSKAFALGILLTLGLVFPSVMVAQPPENEPPQNPFRQNTLRDQLPSDWSFKAPRGIGSPDNTEGGATRGDGSCLAENESIMLLVPPTNISYTVSAYPTFSWYLPSNSAFALKFTLYDENYEEIYTVESNLGTSSENNQINQPQIMSVTLPEYMGVKPLEFNKAYPWEVTLICNNFYRFQDIKAESTIERVPLSVTLQNDLLGASPTEKVVLYANANPYPLWTDTLNSLLFLRRLEPNNREFEQAWIQLLRSAQLDEALNN